MNNFQKISIICLGIFLLIPVVGVRADDPTGACVCWTGVEGDPTTSAGTDTYSGCEIDCCSICGNTLYGWNGSPVTAVCSETPLCPTETVTTATTATSAAVTITSELINPLGTTNINTFAGNLIKAVLGLSGVAALVMFIYGGALWMTSAGSKERVEAGKKTLIWAIFGLVFIFIAYALLVTLLSILGQAGAGA